MIPINTLEQRQAAMRRRHAKKQRHGPVPRQRKPAALDLGKLERRLVAHQLLQRGWSLAQVAAEMNVHIDALTEWNRRGRPIMGLWTVTPLGPPSRFQ
jgi:hypothetical protein